MVRTLPRIIGSALPNEPDLHANLGLWLDRFLPRDDRSWKLEKEDRIHALRPYARAWSVAAGAEALVRRAEGYRLIHADVSPGVRKNTASAPNAAPVMFRCVGKLTGKLLVDHGRANAAEVPVSFHPMWGVPRIPGSALKGLCRWAAGLADGWTDAGRSYLFGEQDDAGHAEFLDAVPEGGRFELVLDGFTPHFGPWYLGDEDLPVEWLSPVPVSMLAVARTRFVFDLLWRGPAEEAERELPRVGALLSAALTEFGVGAKTAGGYGYFEMVRA